MNLEGLATIRHLHLSGTVEDIYGFMSAIPPADLRDLSLCIRGSNAHAIAGAFRGLKRYLPDALESLECTFCGPISKGSKAILRLFHPFLKYHLLKRFSVHMVMGHGMNISDNALRTIGSSWPNLERFALRCGEMPIGPAMTAVRPTIAALIELVRGCPQLQFIRLLGLDVDALPSDDIIPEEGHARLRYLDPCMFVNDEKADLEEVARVLDRLFPDLADFPHKYVDYNTTKDTVSWDKVQELMRARRAARKLKVDIVHDGLSHEVRSDDSLAMISLVLL
ncbi:hypothetical protein LXA43DRAFT_100379 [Ganoderma leucocontextum]|nr:hypothetical protein LXA43DRAFT_100379 [Ganoderma leucocontextum]